jgi:glycosyltransferase involved in cell wall biosynthesis
MSEAPQFSIVLPCRNQADHIGALLPRYLQALDRLASPYELVVVPNACSDRTQAIVEDFARNDSRVRVVVNPLGGWGLSVRTGLDAARGKILAYTNTARTDPELLPTFVQMYLAHKPCLVKARREHRQAPMRELGSLIYNLEARCLFGIRARDVNGTPKLFSREFYQSTHFSATGDLLDMEIMAWASRCGLRIMEIPVEGFRRHGGKSSTTLKSAYKMYLGAVNLKLATLKR